MARPRRNPFYVVLGIVGFLFTITAVSYCLAVLRVVRPAVPTGATAASMSHPLQVLMDRHGAGILAAELLVLAFATVGAVWMDHVEGEKLRAARLAAGRGAGAGAAGGSDDSGGRDGASGAGAP
jgi:hypothetical protein